MADNNFRSYRSRDRLAAANAAAAAEIPVDDPLAELARLIGQGEPADQYADDQRQAPPQEPIYAEPAPQPDWPAEDGRAENHAQDYAQNYAQDYAEDDYADERPVIRDRYDVPRLANTRAADPHAGEPSPRTTHYEPNSGRQRIRHEPRFENVPDAAGDYALPDEPHSQEPPQAPVSRAGQLPAFLPRARVPQQQFQEQFEEDADQQTEYGASADEAYALEDYDEEDDRPRRRSGIVVVAAVLALAVLGTVGAFAYRAMFGGSVLPSLPPIIKAEDGPAKIMPSYGESRGKPGSKADANGSGEKLVSRQENPVDVPAPIPTAPRVVSTIPIAPGPTPGAPGAPPLNSAQGLNSLAPVPQASYAPAAVAPAPPAPVASANPAVPPAAVPEPRKIHTVAIRPDQAASADPGVAAAPAAHGPTSRPVAPKPPAPTPAGGNAPLEIAPAQGDASPPPAPATHTRTALAHPVAAPAPAPEPAPAASTGGYAVQVTSQRSEADAQNEFRSLAAKYPNQLGSRTPIIRRADLGDKGVFYRALVGPFASREQAASLCSSLKAAGGSCLVQQN